MPPFRAFGFAILTVGFSGLLLAQAPKPGTAFTGHTEPVYAVALSPDGKVLATGSFDKTAKLWDIATGKELRSLGGKNGHTNQVLTVAFSPDGSILATGGSDNQLKLWDVPTGKPASAIDHGSPGVRAVLSPDGKTLATAGADGPIKLWTTADGKAGPVLAGHVGPVTGLSFSANGQTLASVGADRTLRYWNAITGALLGHVGVAKVPITGLIHNPATGQFITTSSDGLLTVWPAAPVASKPLPPHTAAVTDLAMTVDGATIVTGSADKTVRVSNGTTAAQVFLFPALSGEVRAVATIGTTTAAGTADGKLVLWGQDGKPKGTFLAHDGGVTGLAFFATTGQIVTAGPDQLVRIWSAPLEAKAVAHPDKVTAIVPLADGKRVFTGSADKLLRSYKDGVFEKQYPGHEALITALAVAGDVLFSGDAAGTVNVWTASTGAKTGTVVAAKKPIAGIVPLAGGKGFAAVAGNDVLLWTDLKAKEAKPLPHPGAVLAAASSVDGKKLLTVCADGKLRAWDLATAKAEPEIALPGTVKAAAFLADGSSVAIVSATGAVNNLSVIPTAANAKPSFSVPVVGEPEAVAISPNGKRIVVALKQPTVRQVRSYDGTAGQELQIFGEPIGVVRDLRILADNRTVAAADEGKQLGLYDMSVTASVKADVVAMTAMPGTTNVASVDKNSVVHLWDTLTGKQIKEFPKLGTVARKVAVSKDGLLLAVAVDKTVKLIAVADGKEVPFPALAADVLAVAISADRTRILVGLADNTAWLYDVATGQPLQFWTHLGPVTAVAFHPSQPAVVTASADKFTAIQSILPIRQTFDAAAVGSVIALSLNSTHYLTAGAGKGVAVWNAASGAKERTFDVEAPVRAVAVSKDGLRLAVAHGADSSVSILNYADGALLGRFNPTTKVAELIFHPSNTSLIGTLADNRVVTWSVALDVGQPLPPEFGKPTNVLAHPAAVRSLVVSTDGTTIVTGADDKLARLWKTVSDQPTKTLVHPNLVDAAAFDKTGKFVATACHDGNLRIWNVATGVADKTIPAHILPQPNPIYAVAWSPDSKLLASASYDKSIKLWDATTAKLVVEMKPGTDRIPPDAHVAKFGPVLLGVQGAGYLNLPPEPGHKDQVFTLAFSKDGKQLASGSSDRMVKLWNAETGQLLREFPNPTLKPVPVGQQQPSHPGFVHVVRWSIDGTKLVTAGTAPRGQGYLAVWNVADGRLLGGQELPIGPIYGMELTPDGMSAILACGPKTRGKSDSEAVVVALPGK